MGDRIVQIANFYGGMSGGLRTTLDALGQGYVTAGLERTLVVPGREESDADTPAGRRITLRGRRLPGGGAYRALTDLEGVRSRLRELAPDRLEVSDKLTLSSLGAWGAHEGVPTVLLSHERIDAILAPRVPPGFPLRSLAKRWNRRLVRSFDTIVGASDFACEEFTALGATNVCRVPLGVDLHLFHPDARGAIPAEPADEPRLVCVGRLSREKRPEIAIETLRLLVRSGAGASLCMVGDGPMRDALERRAEGLPVTFTRHVTERVGVAALIAQADIAIAPCPYETFGLAALEALACGTPVVVADHGASCELLGRRPAPDAGRAVRSDPASFAAAIGELLSVPAVRRRAAARRRAEGYPWTRSVRSMLRVHRVGEFERAAA